MGKPRWPELGRRGGGAARSCCPRPARQVARRSGRRTATLHDVASLVLREQIVLVHPVDLGDQHADGAKLGEIGLVDRPRASCIRASLLEAATGHSDSSVSMMVCCVRMNQGGHTPLTVRLTFQLTVVKDHLDQHLHHDRLMPRLTTVSYPTRQ